MSAPPAAAPSGVTNRLLWRVHELDPSHAPKPASLDRDKHQQALRVWLATQPGLVAELARDELADIMAVTAAIKVMDKRIAARVRTAAPSLLKLFGCAELTAAKVVGETAGVARFRSEAAFASHAGLGLLRQIPAHHLELAVVYAETPHHWAA